MKVKSSLLILSLNFILLLNILYCKINFDYCIELPSNLSKFAIFHIKTLQLDNLCCGYNDLYYAYNIENILVNKTPDIKKFLSIIRLNKYKEDSSIVPLDDYSMISSDHLLKLSKILGLKNCIYLTKSKRGNIIATNCKEIRLQFSAKTSRYDIENAFEKEKNLISYNIIKQFNSILDKSRNCCIHFFSHIESYSNDADHVILLTIFKFKGFKLLLIFDNLNKKIKFGDQSYRYIEYIIKNFKIDLKNKLENI